MTVDERYETFQRGGRYYVPPFKAIPGWRYMPVRADGTLNVDPETLEAPMAFCAAFDRHDQEKESR